MISPRNRIAILHGSGFPAFFVFGHQNCSPRIRYAPARITHTAPELTICLGAKRVRIAAVGDVLLHRPLQRRGYGTTDGFYGIWEAVVPVFRAADIAYANLEGPVAPGMTRGFSEIADPGPVFDDRVYSSFPMFNYHPKFDPRFETVWHRHRVDRQQPCFGTGEVVGSI